MCKFRSGVGGGLRPEHAGKAKGTFSDPGQEFGEQTVATGSHCGGGVCLPLMSWGMHYYSFANCDTYNCLHI